MLLQNFGFEIIDSKKNITILRQNNIDILIIDNK